MPDIKHYEELINKHVQAKKEEEDKAEALRLLKISEYINKLNELQPRVAELVKLGQMCLKNEIEIGLSTTRDNFLADGCKHQLGFWCNYPVRNADDLIGIGIRGGGYAGPIDLVVTPVEVLAISEEHKNNTIVTKDITQCRLDFFEQFLREFDDFEEKFHNYLEGLNG